MNNERFFELLPPEVIVESVESAFQNLNQGQFGNCRLQDIDVSKQIVCGLFHELIVNEISKNIGWRPGKQKVEADLMHESGLHLQVKTSSSKEKIAGNRYSNQNEYASPSEYYLCINFLPFDSICRIKAGYVHADSWNPQTGKGNASLMDKTVLSDLPSLVGKYLGEMNIVALDKFNKSVVRRLNDKGIFKVKDLSSFKGDLMSLVNEKQMIEINKVFELISSNNIEMV